MRRPRMRLFVPLSVVCAAVLSAWVIGQEPTPTDSPTKGRPAEAWPVAEEPTPAYRDLQKRAHRTPSGQSAGPVRVAPLANPAR